MGTRPKAPDASLLDSLPDGLLGHIMALAGREHGLSLMLVSRRWRLVYLNEPGLWRSFTVRAFRVSEAPAERAQRLEQRVALLQRVAQHVVTFRWEEHTDLFYPPCGTILGRCLSVLRSGQLAVLQLAGPCPSAGLAAASAALPQLSSVTSLTLAACLAAPAFVALSTLGSHLRSLELSTRSLAPAVLDRIVQATQLTALSIESYAWPALAALTRLSQLKQLALLDLRGDARDSMQPPAPASFPAGLERFSYESKYRSFQVAGCELSKLRLWEGKGPAFGFSEGAAHHLPLPTLVIGCRCRSLPLAQLLSALQPAGELPQPFQRLELCGTVPDAAAVAAWEQLSQLRELSLAGLRPPPTTAHEQALAALLHHASRLSALAVSSTPHAAVGAVPSCLAVYHGLTSLSLGGQGLTELPDDDYLTDLQQLDLSHNAFVRLPSALSSATALTMLTLNGNRELSLSEDDTAVLLALPCLQLLEVSGIKAADPALLNELRQHMPRLHVVSMPLQAAA